MKDGNSKAWRVCKHASQAAISITAAGAGVVIGAGEFLYNTTSLLWYPDKEVEELEREVKNQSIRYDKVIRNKAAVLDSGIISGVVIADFVASPNSVPESVISAYEAAYPTLAATSTFTDAVQRYTDPEELRGFLAGIKGKLFEVQYVDYLNRGNLPDDYSAELASSANQPGWDIVITGPYQTVVDVLQLKATDSVSYVVESAKRYPDIDVVTTEEVYSQLLLHANIENIDIIDSGISEDSLAELIAESLDIGYGASEFLGAKIPVAALALIALSAYTEQDKNIYQKSFSFGGRSAKALIAMGVGGFVTGFSTWWIGLIGAVGTRLLADRGKQKRLRHRQLKDIVQNNEAVIKSYAYL